MKEDRIITEKCQQCGEQYIPTRKGAQKFCSASCRSRHWFLKKKNKSKLTSKGYIDHAFDKGDQMEKEKQEEQFATVDKMSIGGVGNAAAGAGLVEGAKLIAHALKPEHKKPATKGDIQQLQEALNKRYFPILNFRDPFNRKAFYDKETCNIVIYNEQMNRMELPLI